ncbi:EamA family transporter [Deminuibacter soli]|uniref:EamA family transporter n=1 Tax=Deminuibacter soli TaxID=2291815 RepID=A0A3E1NQW3_9BACT|nr:EamA family transporter [Deminuibacter soli]RFM30326.1 EamA family transporter [Deminuibacter soli]
MLTENPRPVAPKLLVILAFATVYIVWGSTYFFIRIAVAHIPAMLMAAMRFTTAGLLLLGWCAIKGEKLFVAENIKPAIISGLLLLFIGNGAVVWVEQYLTSSLVAVLVSACPLWFVLLDKPLWKENFSNRFTISGLLVGFVGVLLLFGERLLHSDGTATPYQVPCLIILLFSTMSWSGGSLYSRYFSKGPGTVNTAWQMLAAGIAFIICAAFSGETKHFDWQAVPAKAWLAVTYLIVMGSLAAYSAYVWLLQVRPSTQVSTYAYVNPVVAVLLGIFFADEHMSLVQLAGLVIILVSVLLINLNKYRQAAAARKSVRQGSLAKA